MLDLLFALVLVEGAVCLASAYAVGLLVLSGHHHHRLGTPLAIFAVAASGLLLTGALADVYRTRQHRDGRA